MPSNNCFRLRYSMRMSANAEEADIMIYGEICSDWWKWAADDISALDFDKLLKEAKAKGARKLTVRINSPGGHVDQAVAMRTMLMNSGIEEIVISIEGMCASAATLIACLPGAKVIMSEGGEYMIHNPTSGVWGEAKAFEAEAKRMRNLEQSSASIYAKKSGQSEEDIRKWMDAETWMTASEAKERGFVDAVLDDEPIAAVVSVPAMSAMRGMYTHIPDRVQQRDEPPVSNETPAVAAGNSTEHIPNQREEGAHHMSTNTLTRDQLREENAALYDEIMQAGMTQERERIEEIDALTPAGYESMAADAKKNGTSAMDFHKQIVKAQREKGAQHLEQRQKETQPAQQIAGGNASDHDAGNTDDQIAKNAKEMAEMAKSMVFGGLNGGMY